MLRLVIGRLLTVLPSIAGVIIVTFLLTHALPGDPAVYYAGPQATEKDIDEVRHYFGFDRSWPVQFVLYLQELAHGDLGKSLTTGRPVLTEIMTRLPASAELTLFGMLISMTIALPLGVMAATRPGSWVDHLCRIVSTAGVSLPTFFSGLLLVYVFYYLLGWAPAPLGRLSMFYLPPPRVTGFYLIDSLIAGNFETFRSALAQLILPALTLGFSALAPLARITRASMLAALSSDFVRTARASGLSRWQIVVVYALRNAILPVVTTLGMVFAFLLGANVLVERVFAWPGIGSFAIEALVASDYAAVQGFVLAMALFYVTLNLLIDIIYGILDPRIQITE
jgi:ABC-type dipeptide/oligopeptide/nickel transport system permease component